jgi:hypothetical protein
VWTYHVFDLKASHLVTTPHIMSHCKSHDVTLGHTCGSRSGAMAASLHSAARSEAE